eukprot:11217183-Lingulodinium_polyedra.AAC.1
MGKAAARFNQYHAKHPRVTRVAMLRLKLVRLLRDVNCLPHERFLALVELAMAGLQLHAVS